MRPAGPDANSDRKRHATLPRVWPGSGGLHCVAVSPAGFGEGSDVHEHSRRWPSGGRRRRCARTQRIRPDNLTQACREPKERASTVSDDIHEALTAYLTDAHSIEEQALAQLNSMRPHRRAPPRWPRRSASISPRPTGHEQHRQARCSSTRDADPSWFKDAVMKLGGKGFVLFARAQPGHPGQAARPRAIRTRRSRKRPTRCSRSSRSRPESRRSLQLRRGDPGRGGRDEGAPRRRCFDEGGRSVARRTRASTT